MTFAAKMTFARRADLVMTALVVRTKAAPLKPFFEVQGKQGAAPGN